MGNGDQAYTEIYEGDNGRPSILVRMERVEMSIASLQSLVNRLAYIATAVLIAVVIGSGSLIFAALMKQ